MIWIELLDHYCWRRDKKPHLKTFFEAYFIIKTILPIFNLWHSVALEGTILSKNVVWKIKIFLKNCVYFDGKTGKSILCFCHVSPQPKKATEWQYAAEVTTCFRNMMTPRPKTALIDLIARDNDSSGPTWLLNSKHLLYDCTKMWKNNWKYFHRPTRFRLWNVGRWPKWEIVWNGIPIDQPPLV